MYNQYENYYTRNACSIVSLLMIMLYNYGIKVHPNFIMKVAIFFDKLGLWSPDNGAVFHIIYKGFVIILNKKLDLKFKVVTKQIETLPLSDKRTYGLGIKGYSSRKYKKIYEDKVITKEDIDYLATWKGGIGHNLIWDGGGYFKDTNGKPAAKMKLDVLQYGYKKGLFWNNIRTIVPADLETEAVCKYTIELFKAEKRGDIQDFISRHGGNTFDKAKKLYFYGRENVN